MSATALRVGDHHAEKLHIGGWACSRRGAAYPIWRHDRETAQLLLTEWATADLLPELLISPLDP